MNEKKTARLVLQAISVLGTLLGLSCLLAGIGLLLPIRREASPLLCLPLVLSGLMLTLGAWLIRDSYLTLRGRSFALIKSASAVLALVFLCAIGALLQRLESRFVGEQRHTWQLLTCAAWVASLIAAVVLYSICTKLLNRLARTGSTRVHDRSCDPLYCKVATSCFPDKHFEVETSRVED